VYTDHGRNSRIMPPIEILAIIAFIVFVAVLLSALAGNNDDREPRE
jgi:hypothetical protein